MSDQPTEEKLPEVPPAMPPPPGPIESAVVAVLVPKPVRQIMLGRIQVDWDELPDGILPLGINHDELEGKCYITQSKITFSRGEHSIKIPKGYAFDGASVPHIFWGIRGFSPIGRHLWAALVHDFICDFPNVLFPGIGDAIFVRLLTESGVPTWRAAIMHVAVRLNHLIPRPVSAAMGVGIRWLFRLAVLALVGFGVWKVWTIYYG